MTRSCLAALACAAVAAACETAPISPTIAPPPSVPAVPTQTPNVWDTSSELRGWVNNGVSTGAASVVGDGLEAVIRLDAGTRASFHGPDFDPPLTDVTAARVRYRWIGKGTNEVLLLDMYLRPPALDASLTYPHLFFIPSDLSRPPANASGEWVDELFTSHGTSNGPYSVKFAILDVTGDGTYGPATIHGIVEIDRIALLR